MSDRAEMKNITPQPVTVGTVYTIGDTSYTVWPACNDTAIGNGVWHCTTHGEVFANQLQKDLHVGTERNAKRTCVLAWFCLTHNVAEVP